MTACIQLYFDAITIPLVITMLQMASAPQKVVMAYATMQCLYHLGCLGAVFHLASLGAARYLKLIALVALMIAAG